MNQVEPTLPNQQPSSKRRAPMQPKVCPFEALMMARQFLSDGVPPERVPQILAARGYGPVSIRRVLREMESD